MANSSPVVPSSRVVRCLACGSTVDETPPPDVCPFCGGLPELRHQLTPELGNKVRDLAAERRKNPEHPLDRSGVWRFREIVYGGEHSPIATLGEGGTRLIRLMQIGDEMGIELHAKHEGDNPTGSFKDRGMTVVMSDAVRRGSRVVLCASTGNTSASAAAYATSSGLKAGVVLPKGQVALGKLAQTLFFGAQLLEVDGSFDDAMHLVRELSQDPRVTLVNSANPIRLDGQRTIVFEAFEQLGYEAVDWLVFPAGNLGNCSAFGWAVDDMVNLGWLDRPPRLAAVQAAGAAPFHASFEQGLEKLERVQPETVATAIRIGNPVSFPRARLSIEKTDGVVLSVTDEQILEAQRRLARDGVGCEPASAASLAGLQQLCDRGEVTPGDRVVLVLTGHLLKDPQALLSQNPTVQQVPAGEVEAAAQHLGL